MPRKLMLGVDVLAAARQRVAWVFDTFERICVSFSGGKDSTVMLHLAMEEAVRRRRRVAVLFVDLEAQYALTVAHVERMFADYAAWIDPYWLALPIALRNAVSVFQPKWQCWDPAARAAWVRPLPRAAIADPAHFRWFRPGMEFEELVPAFGEHLAGGALTACLVGIRSDESLNRWRSIASATKTRFEGRSWTTWLGGPQLWNVYPIYDWRNEDLWAYHGRTGLPYNPLYDRMRQAGLTLSQMRICQPYGDDQRRGLWLYSVIEPETWGRVVARVNGANGGALYAQERGNVNGTIRIDRPPGHTWQSFSELLLASMPEGSAAHFRDKIAVFLRWWTVRGYAAGIPDEASPAEEAARKTPSWRRICKALLRNDYWCKGLSFTQTKSENFERYRRIMARRRSQWGIYA